MKKSRLLMFALVAVMVAFAMAPMCGVMAADDDTITVSVRLEGQTENLIFDDAYEYTIPEGVASTEVSIGAIVEQFMKDNKISYEMSNGYVTKIGNLVGGGDYVQAWGWMFSVNNVHCNSGLDSTAANEGDAIVGAYVDMNVIWPAGYNVTRDEEGKYTLSLLGYKPENWSYDDVLDPLDGLTVYIDGTKLEGTTDAEGSIVLPEKYTAGGEYKIQLEMLTDYQVNEKSVSKIARVAPGSYIEVSNFTDLAGADWAKDNIYALVNAGIINGKTLDTYAPQEGLTRAQLVKMLFVADGQDEADFTGATKFDDVKAGSWYAPYVQWAADNGIAQGTSDTTFGPNDFVTREQAATFINRFLTEYLGITLDTSGEAVNFADADAISSYAKTSVEAMAKAGIIEGKPSDTDPNTIVFAPKANTTRAEAAALVSRVYIIVIEAENAENTETAA